MKLSRLLSVVALAAIFLPTGALAQAPDGSDINKAIPIYFGQIVEDIGDSGTVAHRVYAITLARGQQISATMTLPNSAAKAIEISLLEPTRRSVAGVGYSGDKGGLATDYGTSRTAVGFTYTVAAPGTYFILVTFGSTSVSYALQIKAQGTPIAVPNPVTAGCLRGAVDYITYSLQLIAVGLADELSIGGTKVCANCQVKAPLYPEIVNRIENALRSKVNAEACYDATGNIFQIKLVQ